MKILSVLLSVTASFSALAGGVSSVGKLTSGICGSTENQLHGSGVVVNVSGENMLVTSEHAVLASDWACHSLGIGGQEYNLDFVLSDYRHGLALFKIRSGEKLASFNFDHIHSPTSSSSEILTAVGFPINSNSVLIDKSVSIISESNRSLFADIKQVFEVKGVHAEKGMSGGALLNSSNDTLLGILTSLTAQTGITNSEVVLVIPANDVKVWIQSALQGKTSALRRDPRSQNSSQRKSNLNESILGPGIQIESFKSSVQSSAGGADGLGIGGSDIAGDEIKITMTDLATFEMAKNSNELSWLNQIRQAFNNRSTVQIEKVIIFQVQNGEFLTLIPKNTSEFLKIMKNSDAIIILKNDSNSSATGLNYNGPATGALNRLLNSAEPAEQVLGLTLKTIFNLKVQHPDLRIPESVITKLKNHPALSDLATEETDGFELVVTIQKELSTLSMAKPGL